MLDASEVRPSVPRVPSLTGTSTPCDSLSPDPLAENDENELKERIGSPSSQIKRSLTIDHKSSGCCRIVVFELTFSCKYSGMSLTQLPLQKDLDQTSCVLGHVLRHVQGLVVHDLSRSASKVKERLSSGVFCNR